MKHKIGSIILKIITILLAVLVVYLVYTKITGGIPQFFGYRILQVVSPSMEDTLREGEYILIRTVDTDSIKQNDIITFYSSNPEIAAMKAPITHRVVQINEDGSFVTKGDNNENEDDNKYPAEPDKVIGKYVSKLTAVTWLTRNFKKPIVFMFIIIIPLLIILSVRVIKIINTAKKKNDGGDEGNG